MSKKYYIYKRVQKKTNYWLLIGLGLIIGLINGFFGGGGGMLVVPLLAYGLGLVDKKAHATAIFIILPLCLVSACVYVFQGTWDGLSTLWTGIGAVCGGLIGALILKRLSNKVIRFIFSLIMIGAGIKMIL